MRKGTISNLVESYLDQAGGSQQVAGDLAAHKLDTLFKEKEITPSDFSIKALFEELVNTDNKLDMHSSVEDIAEAVASSAFATITNTVMNNSVIPAYESAVGDAASLVSEVPAVKTGPEEVPGYTAGAAFAQRLETMSYEEDQIAEKFWVIDKSDFGKIISLTRESIFDDRTGQLISRAQRVGEKGGVLRAQIITQTLEVAARTSQGESGTGRAAIYENTAIAASNFYNNDHSALIDKAGANDNLQASNALANATDINAANLLLSGMIDEAGDKVGITGDTIVVPSGLVMTAHELTDSKVKVGASNEQENYFFRKFRVAELPHLSSATTWFLGAPKKQMLWLWVWKPETKVQRANSEMAFSNQVVLRYRFAWYGGVGHSDYRFIIKNTA